jgi:hypothetical protein
LTKHDNAISITQATWVNIDLGSFVDRVKVWNDSWRRVNYFMVVRFDKAWIFTLLAWIVFGCAVPENVPTNQSQSAQNGEQDHATISPFYFECSLTQVMPNSENGGNRIRRFFKATRNGGYEVKRDIILANNNVGYSNTMRGVLLNDQLFKLNEIMGKLESSATNCVIVPSNRRGGVVSPWNGYVKFTKNGKTCDVKFDSQYSQPPIVQTLVRDIEQFFRTEFNL